MFYTFHRRIITMKKMYPNWIERKREILASTSTSILTTTTATTINFKDTRSMYRCCFGFVNRVIFFCHFFLFQAYVFCLLDTPLSFHPIVFERFRIVVVTKTAVFFSIWFETSKHFYSERSSTTIHAIFQKTFFSSSSPFGFSSKNGVQ